MAIHLLGDDPLKKIKTIRKHDKNGNLLPAGVGTFADGKGLYIRARAPGQGSWTVIFGTLERCIGPCDLITPKAARALHQAMREERHAGRDPWSLMLSPVPAPASPMVAIIEAKREADTNRKRFADVVESAIPILSARNDWKATSTEPRKYRDLKTGALGKMWTDEIDQTHIANELNSRWGHALPSADKYRMRIKAVLDNATANKLRPNTPNPADAKIMNNLLVKAPKSRPHPSMPVKFVPAFMDDLLDVQDKTARAFAFLLHTAARSAEAIGARWEEIEETDGGKVWHIPAARMKEGATNGDHWVPLSDAAFKLLGTPKKSGRIFEGLAHDVLDNRLKELRPDMLVPVRGFPDAPPSVHGMRTSFVEWAEKTGERAVHWDRALHHSSKVGGKYSGHPMTEERAPLMLRWSAFLTAY